MKNVKFKMTEEKMNAGLLENKDSEYSWKMKRLLNDSTQNVQSDPTVSSFINLFNFFFHLQKSENENVNL